MTISYDVLIIGGGPAGSTLASRLRQISALSVCVVEREEFPRDHIGESFSQRVVSALAEIGALGKIMQSGAAIKKYGGYYAWDGKRPATTFFDAQFFREDGIHRWAIHVDRARFDDILLKHSQEQGATVLMPENVESTERIDGQWHVRLKSGRTIEARVIVDATGRFSQSISHSKRGWLSEFKNIAIWNHYIGGAPAQTLKGDWNIFRKDDLSAIGCFAYDDGWYWYIPVPKLIDGKRVETHSIGLVTDTSVAKAEGGKLQNVEAFTKQISEIPLLQDLVADGITPISDSMHTASNYSMISEQLCSYEEQWVRIGDAGFFVDPLFSSGVALAMLEALNVATMISASLSGNYGQQQTRDLWLDFNHSWQKLGRSFATVIDQWYVAIAESHPESAYWNRRATKLDFDFRDETFQSIVDTNMVLAGDLGEVIKPNDLGNHGPYFDVAQKRHRSVPRSDTYFELAKGASVREGLKLPIGSAKGSPLPDEKGLHVDHQAFWRAPEQYDVPTREAQPLLVSYLCNDGVDARIPLSELLSCELAGLANGVSKQIAADLCRSDLIVLAKLVDYGLVVETTSSEVQGESAT